MQPSVASDQFYTGLIAEAYAPLRGHVAPVEPYARFVREHGEPALEIGCGHGEPLLDLIDAGLDVTGLDSSADMLRLCEADAARRGHAVGLIHARMEDFRVSERFRSIYIAGPTFQLVLEIDDAGAALQRIAEHLHTDGRALVPLFVPEPAAAHHLGRWKEHTRADGEVLAFQVVEQSYRPEERRVDSTLRYRRGPEGDPTELVERVWSLRWYDAGEFEALANRAGLAVDHVIDHGAAGQAMVLRKS